MSCFSNKIRRKFKSRDSSSKVFTENRSRRYGNVNTSYGLRNKCDAVFRTGRDEISIKRTKRRHAHDQTFNSAKHLEIKAILRNRISSIFISLTRDRNPRARCTTRNGQSSYLSENVTIASEKSYGRSLSRSFFCETIAERYTLITT